MTHINAYHAAVAEAEAKVAAAKGMLDVAVADLKAHPDYKPEPKDEPKASEPVKK